MGNIVGSGVGTLDVGEEVELVLEVPMSSGSYIFTIERSIAPIKDPSFGEARIT